MNEITIEHGKGALGFYAKVIGISNPITVEGPKHKPCIQKALDRVSNDDLIIKFVEK